MKRRLPNLTPARPGIDDGYWVNRDSYKRIGSECPKPMDPKLVYLRLNKIMCDIVCPEFACQVRHLAEDCRLTRNRTEKALWELERIGLIKRRVFPGDRMVPTLNHITITGKVKYE